MWVGELNGRAFQIQLVRRRYVLGRNQPGHAWLAQHYKWAIDRIFLEKKHSHLIIAEDDMLFSPDFVAYFKQTAVLLERDPSLWRGDVHCPCAHTTTFIKAAAAAAAAAAARRRRWY